MARGRPVATSHTPTLPSLAPTATRASSLDHATQQTAESVRVVSAAIKVPDEVLQRRMQASADAVATKEELGLKCTLLIAAVCPVRVAMATWVCVSHRRSVLSSEAAKEFRTKTKNEHWASAENHRHDHQLIMIINNTWMHIMIIISIVISIKNVIIRTLLKHYNRK